MAEFLLDDTKQKVMTIVAEKLNIDKQQLVGAKSFQDLGADSLDMVEIVMKLEETFGVEIKDEDAEKLQTIDEVATYINGMRTK